MKRQSFIYGTVVLFTANLFNRIVGFTYQIFTVRLIGPEGVGLFNIVYPIYVLALVAATAGIPVAVAKIVAEEVAKNNYKGAHRVFNLSLLYILAFSLLVTCALFTGAPYLQEKVFPNPKVYYCFLYLIPGIIIVSLCSAFRGYFQGLQQMVPTAVTQVLEQSVRVTAGLTLAYLFLPRGVEYAAVGISLGVVLGELVGFIFMLGFYFFNRPAVEVAFPRILGGPKAMVVDSARIFGLSVPVTFTRLVTTGVMSVDAILIPHRLQAAGFSISEATAAYGELISIAMSLILTPGVLTFALATALVPAVSDAVATRSYHLVQARINESLRVTMLAGLPAVVLLLALPERLCGLLFGYPEAGSILRLLALGGPFLYFTQTTTAVLQGMGAAERPLKNLVAGSVVKVTGVYFLTAIPSLGINGAAFALSISYSVTAILNYADMRRLTGLTFEAGAWLAKPLLASLCIIPVINQSLNFLSRIAGDGRLCTVSSLLVGMTAYLLLVYAIGGINRRDLQRVKNILGIK